MLGDLKGVKEYTQSASPSKNKGAGRSRSGQRNYPRTGGNEDKDESVGLVGGDCGGYSSASESDSTQPETGIRLVTSSQTRI